MAGHSKWANIQHRKGRQDAKRGRLFSKLIREITIAARVGDPDPAANPRLRAAVDEAGSHNVPKDTIERAIRRAAGDADSERVEEVRYEGYGPGGVAVMVDCMTDNRKRTVAEVRHAFSKCGGNLGTDGSVSYLFSKTGLISFSGTCDEERLLEAALDAGADDVIGNDHGSFDVLVPPEEFINVKERLQAAGFEPESAEITMRAAATQTLDEEGAEGMLRLLEMLEELDDVQKVYSNAEIPDEILEMME